MLQQRRAANGLFGCEWERGSVSPVLIDWSSVNAQLKLTLVRRFVHAEESSPLIATEQYARVFVSFSCKPIFEHFVLIKSVLC